MDHDTAMHFIAQAVVNIDSGLTVIEKGSKVYRAMVALIEEERDRLGLYRNPAAKEFDR